MRKMYEKGLKEEQGVAGRSQLNEIKLPYVVGQWLCLCPSLSLALCLSFSQKKKTKPNYCGWV